MGRCYTKMVNAYLLISDLHDTDANIPNRINYQNEIIHVKNKIIEVCTSYKDKGYCVYPIFMGDIINRSYKGVIDGININNFLVLLSSEIGQCYSLVGNHELSFYKNNPFWATIRDMSSAKIANLRDKVWQPQGMLNVLRVVDMIEDGEVLIHFNHYSTPISKPLEGKVNIGLFHQDILFRGITSYIKEVYETTIWDNYIQYVDDSSILNGYKHAFLGHFHEIYGSWMWEDNNTSYETQITYLASLGRPKHVEVRDNFLERNLPAIIVKDGTFSHIEDNKFQLLPRHLCVKEDIVEKQKNSLEHRKAKKELINYFSYNDDPIENIKGRLMANGENDLIIFEELTSPNGTFEKQVNAEFNSFMKGRYF